ncbi:MAG TPA: ABC transporter ATP-binding protein [Phycisphaerales bacterium]|nr:ABC transporter ATP-binding protein [Phycisphaerales bacterium]
MTNALEVSNLTFAYPGTPFRLEVPALSLAPGEQMLLTAPSGAGKSTLLQLICGLLDPAGGSVRIAGESIHAAQGAARDRLRGRRIGVIFQTFHLLTGFTARENVMLAMLMAGVPAGEHGPRAATLLSRLGIERPDARVEELSVGQQQRVGVARALACEPALVLADEPTASLDPENADAAFALIQDACREKNSALLCVSHDPRAAPRFSRRVTLAELSRGGAA